MLLSLGEEMRYEFEKYIKRRRLRPKMVHKKNENEDGLYLFIRFRPFINERIDDLRHCGVGHIAGARTLFF